MITPDRKVPTYFDNWPGKKQPEGGGPKHPAACHMLDVAAAAEILLADVDPHLPLARRHLFCLLVALHDLGKFGAQFQAMLHGGPAQQKRHWEVTEAWLREGAMERLLCDRLGGRHVALRPLVAAIAGHHGRPPRDEAFDRMRAAAGPEAAAAARAFVEACLDLWPQASLAGLRAAEACRLSWWLSGLTVVADWVGSNPEWFPAVAPPASASAYLAEARKRAAVAVRKAGLTPPAPAGSWPFDFARAAARPMQAAALEIPLRDGPMLAVIEDETGTGKTEAALILAQRMMLAGKGRGLYFGLPTMATADAMFGRARRIVRALFAAPPSLTLAHGRAGIMPEFSEVKAASGWSEDVVCGPWLSDSRRRALLADVGVGTIDQALLAILPTKFATLRHYGLASRILIVDEAHELGAPYMAHQLATLLRLHAMRGGSAILLTATLPLRLRADLARAFEEGAGRTAVDDPDPAYPALTIPGGAARRDFPGAASPKGPVRVARLGASDDAVALIAGASARGAACAWVRNAVDDAIAAVEALRAAGVEAELLHARYALGDRRRIEADMRAAFGREGARRRPDGRGRVLVATQVAEASLDLDFDVMVSDLAPIAALIQRAGRLWRHMDLRPAAGRPVSGPILHVLAPDPAARADERWLRALQPAGSWVYDAAKQWRTADALFRAGEIVAPGGLRALIEAVHGEETAAVPPGLEAAERKVLGESYAEANLARWNVINIEQGYRDGGGAADDREYPTRLGQPTRALVLARESDRGLLPWIEGGSRAEAEMLSEVSARSSRLAPLPLPDQSTPAIAAFTAGWPDWKRASLTVCPVSPDGAICEGLRYDPAVGLLFPRAER